MTAVLALRPLRARLTARERSRLASTLERLLAWQRTLNGFPAAVRAPDATPIVSLYADGTLRGCAYSDEGRGGERLARAFLFALGDPRAHSLDPRARGRLVAELSYARDLRRVSWAAAPALIAPGAHGLALEHPGGTTLLVPDVAREAGLDAGGLLDALSRKAALGVAERTARLYLFETERIVVPGTRSSVSRAADAISSAVRWLCGRVGSDGAMSFGLDPKAGRDEPVGPFHHGRAAVAVAALSAHPLGRSAAERARRWLGRELARALGGAPVPGFPKDVPGVAGTLALASLAGVAVGPRLAELSLSDALGRSAWHAAQVACALGSETPPSLWRSLVRALDRDARAPWTLLAARARGDARVVERTTAALVAALRPDGPHRGSVTSGGAPEVALTALTVEALAGGQESAVRAGLVEAVAFLEGCQVGPDSLPEALDASRALGAFPLTPVCSFLRTDVTAHAVLALLAAKAGPRGAR